MSDRRNEGEREREREKEKEKEKERTEETGVEDRGSPLPEPSSLSGEKVTLIRKARRDF